ncbi:MAG: class I SAM-dependent methyltransferase [Phycisphaerales bacterium]|nr:class I SAM-dependent methyltransferase [Phycisphaerales bacterium]
MRSNSFVAMAGTLTCWVPVWAQSGTQPTVGVVEKMRGEAEALLPLTQTALAKEFLAGVESLRPVESRTLFYDRATRTWYTAEVAAKLPEEERAKLREVPVTDQLYYQTFYGTPLAYVRPIELLGLNGIESLDGKRILDFGYGTIGHLRMMASQGAEVVGVEVDSLFNALYNQPSDTGAITGAGGQEGSISLVDGRFSDPKVKQAVGGGYDIIVSKNTLKRGYVHPPAELEGKLDKNRLVDLGLDDEAFVKVMFDLLKPGGRLLIYNLSPKQKDWRNGEQYIPWADGQCPFERELLERVGFRVVKFDEDDGEAARKMAYALKWDQTTPPMDVEGDLFAHFTLVEKP